MKVSSFAKHLNPEIVFFRIANLEIEASKFEASISKLAPKFGANAISKKSHFYFLLLEACQIWGKKT